MCSKLDNHKIEHKSMEEMLAKLGLKGIYLLTGLIAGTVALAFGGKRKTWGEKVRAVIIVITGAIVTAYITPLIFLWNPSWEQAEYGIAFVVGLFGMGVIETIFKLLDKLSEYPIAFIKAFMGKGK